MSAILWTKLTYRTGRISAATCLDAHETTYSQSIDGILISLVECWCTMCTGYQTKQNLSRAPSLLQKSGEDLPKALKVKYDCWEYVLIAQLVLVKSRMSC